MRPLRSLYGLESTIRAHKPVPFRIFRIIFFSWENNYKIECVIVSFVEWFDTSARLISTLRIESDAIFSFFFFHRRPKIKPNNGLLIRNSIIYATYIVDPYVRDFFGKNYTRVNLSSLSNDFNIVSKRSFSNFALFF